LKKRTTITGKVGNTEMRADVPMIFCGKGIDLAVQMNAMTFGPDLSMFIRKSAGYF
jgi:hypothetical protein